MIRAFAFLLLPFAAQAETLRVATFNTELSRDGPGLLLRDIQRGDPQVSGVVRILTEIQPDVVALQGIDWDHDGLALIALNQELSKSGLDYPHVFAPQPNSGRQTDVDLYGDGKTNGPGDAQGWGRFTGQGGLAVLSRYPIAHQDALNFSDLIWRAVPGANLPVQNGSPFPSKQALSVQRLSSTGHWVVPIDAPDGQFHLMTFHASPPVFDGPEDRNGRRNWDEIRFWQLFLDGAFGPAPDNRFVIAGDANLDSHLGEGHKAAIRDLLADNRIQDPRPSDAHGSLSTVSWKGVGKLRVDYVLPSTDWSVADAGVYRPVPGSPGNDVQSDASRHYLVWVDLVID
ncbi:MAG: endonuclease/exonuclease/phosphatase family protein [Ruegeria sp.]